MLPEHYLESIASPQDLKDLSVEDLNCLCAQIREKLIHTVSKTGGHLASNLGVVELTVALHKVFDTPSDEIVWDVGHQCYTHKILTGRLGQLDSMRTEGGISGFPKRNESVYDSFNSGHSSTSISAALGIAQAKQLSGEPGHVVAVIGDGALSGGLAYEGLNNAGRFKKSFIVVLNDNKMSISRNVGSMARYLAGMRTRPGYLKIKQTVEWILQHTPFVGKSLRNFLLRSKSVLKNLLYKSTWFEDMGFIYYGPFDGHDMDKLLHVLNLAKKVDRPVLIHVITTKGKGYPFAERNPKDFHGISGFDVETGEHGPSGENFSEVFGRYLCTMAEDDDRICAITAAMKLGTGLTDFSRKYKERFFDVGIAEEHAVTFAGGLAAGGMLPVFAVYSTFLQRSYDQIIHDAALQNLNVTLAVDRAGVVGEDGETHQGLFDVSFFNSIPNVTVYSPTYYDELWDALNNAVYDPGVDAVRYPRGGELFRPQDYRRSAEGYCVYGDADASVALVTYGRLFSYACLARDKLCGHGIPLAVVKLDRIKPIPEGALEAAQKREKVFFFEEGMLSGGAGERFEQQLDSRGFPGKYFLHAVDDVFVPQATMKETLAALSLDDEGMRKIILTECAK